MDLRARTAFPACPSPTGGGVVTRVVVVTIVARFQRIIATIAAEAHIVGISDPAPTPVPTDGPISGLPSTGAEPVGGASSSLLLLDGGLMLLIGGWFALRRDVAS